MKLVRRRSDPPLGGTPGTLALKDGTQLHSLELPWLENRNSVSCITAGGRHPLRVRERGESKRFPYPHVAVGDTPGRSAILLHGANWGGSKADGFKSELRGCIAPGLEAGHNGEQPYVSYSRAALELVVQAVRDGDDWLEIEWEDESNIAKGGGNRAT